MAAHLRLRYRVSVGDVLDLALEVVNTSPLRSRSRRRCTPIWPSATSSAVAVSGLEDTIYLDKVDAFARKRHGAEPLRLTGETDRVFLGTRARCVVDDPVLGRR